MNFLYTLFFLFLPFGASYIPPYALGQPSGTLFSLHIYIYIYLFFVCLLIQKKKKEETISGFVKFDES